MMDNTRVIATEGVGKQYGSVAALSGVSFTVGRGEVIGLLGPNGAGKTTLIRILTGYHYPSAGRATVTDLDVTRHGRAIKERIGYLPENAPIYHDMQVHEYLHFIAAARGVGKRHIQERIATVVAQCGLREVLLRSIGTISKGYRQRVGLAQALIHDPDILILDEPTSGLDPNQVIDIRSLIRELGKEKTVILSTHVMQEVEAVCDRVLIINEGKLIAQGTANEIAAQMKGEARHVCAFYTSGNRDIEEVRETLRAVEQVSAIVSLERIESEKTASEKTESEKTASTDDKQFYHAEVTLSNGYAATAGEALFQWAVSSGVVLTSLSTSNLKLEDIFVRLTK